MRTIKFRGLTVGDKPFWVHGDLIHTYDYTHQLVDEYGQLEIKIVGGLQHEIIPESAGQFTGLTDKNGVEIYEGDIVKSTFSYNNESKTIIGTVEHDEINPSFVIRYKWQGDGHDCYEYDFVQCGLRKNEVIGNIHQDKQP